jgi:hypothetical protein
MHRPQRASFNDSSREWPATHIDLEIQLLRLVQLALAGAEIVKQLSEEVRHQGSSLMSIDGVADHGVGAGSDQLVALLNGDGAAPVPAEVLARPDGEQKARDSDGSSQPEGPKASRPELEVKPEERDASCRAEDDRDQEDEG